MQLCALIFIYVAYFCIRFLLPKKHRLTDYQLKKLGKHINAITMNIVSPLDGIGEMLKKAMGIFEHFNSSWRESSHEVVFLEFLQNQKQELTVFNSKVASSFIKPLIKEFPTNGKIVHEVDAGHSAMEYVFESKKLKREIKIIVLQTTGGDGPGTRTDYFQISNRFATDVTVADIVDLYCESLGNSIYISLDNETNEISIQQLSVNKTAMEHYVCPETKYQELISEIKHFNSVFRQRSYLLVGPPGTGKTSFCFETATRIGGRIMKLDNDIIMELGEKIVQEIIESLNAKIVIVDDIDRLRGHDASQLLFAVESMKAIPSMPTLFATVNNIDELDQALIRPGRFDEIIEFDVPDSAELREFVFAYCAKSKIAMKPEDAEKMIVTLTGYSQAYIVEYLEQLNFEKDIEKIVKRIEKRKKYLRREEF